MPDEEVRTPRPRRKNGVTPPFTSAQMSTWFALPSLVIEFLVVVSPILPVAVSIPCTIVFFITACSSAVNGLRAMTIDPADPRLPTQEERENGEGGDGNEEGNGHQQNCSNNGGTRSWDPNEPTKHCWICRHDVSEKSMHCKFCNKCVHTFDHHCMWLNTCVGKANYPYFFRTMISIAVMLIIHGTIQIALIIDIYVGDSTSSSARASSWFGSQKDTTIPVVAIMGVFILFDVLSFSLIAQLLAFHMQLRRQGLTTYQFIYQENRKKAELRKLKRALENRRMVAIANASRDGRTNDRFKLRMGGILREKGCACCDPLQLDNPESDKQQQQHKETTQQQANGNGVHVASVDDDDDSNKVEQEDESKEIEESA